MPDAMITQASLVRDLRQLGIEDGDQVALGISLRAVGPLEGGADTLIDALLEAVGPGGTLMLPAFTSSYPLRELDADKPGHVFDPANSPPGTGAVPRVLLKRPGTLRSRHPTCSMAVVGAQARALVAGHDEKAPAYQPYSTLADGHGKVLSVGIGDKLVGHRHQAQYLAGLLDMLPPTRGVYYRTASDGCARFVRRDLGGCVTRLPDLVTEMRERGMVCDGRVGQASSLVVAAADSLTYMTRQLTEHPGAYLCRRRLCTWCRGIEARSHIRSSRVDAARKKTCWERRCAEWRYRLATGTETARHLARKLTRRS